MSLVRAIKLLCKFSGHKLHSPDPNLDGYTFEAALYDLRELVNELETKHYDG